MNDRSVIQAIKNNDNKKVIRELYKLALPSITDFIRANGGSRQDAEDAFQEGVIGLITAIKTGRFKEEYTIRNYLFGIARNQWFTEVKKRNNNSINEYEAADYETEIHKLIDSERTSTMHGLIESLGKKCAELLKLTIFEGKKNKEISQIMGFNNEKVVKATYYRCKQKLRDKISKKPQLVEILKGD